MTTSTPLADDHRYDTQLYGATPTGYRGFEAPWAFGSVRVDGVAAGEPLSPVIPGRTVTYECTFAPQPAGGDPDDDHAARLTALAQYLVHADDVLLYDPPGTEVFYREQYDGASALLRIAPLRPDHDASWVDGDPPPGRDSIHEPRWAVVTGGEPARPLPDRASTLTLETVTIGATADYPTRDAMLAAAERNGF
jgi:hypothetical protein